MNRSFQPLGDRVVVKPIEKEEVTSSGLVLPDTAKEKPQEGEIVAVGRGRVTDDGKTIELEVKVDERRAELGLSELENNQPSPELFGYVIDELMRQKQINNS